MFTTSVRPRITEYQQMSQLVSFLRLQGVMDSHMAKRMSEIGAVDLDVLQEILGQH